MPRALMQAYAELGIWVRQGWGMTESSPVVTINAPKPSCLKLEGEALLGRRCAQGRVVFGADIRAQDEGGQEVAWDGTSQGNSCSAAIGSPAAISACRQNNDAEAGFLPAMSA